MSDHTMESLTKELNTILDVVPSGSRIAFLDYPVYANIGDILVMKGTERFFQTNKMNIIVEIILPKLDYRGILF
jgi:pyruvyl transferase EpsO